MNIHQICLPGSKQSLFDFFLEPSDDLNDLNFFNQKKKKKKSKKVFDNDIEESLKVWWDFFPRSVQHVCAVATCLWFYLLCLLIISLLTLPNIDLF